MSIPEATVLRPVESNPRSLQDWTASFTPGRLALLLTVLLFAAYPEVILGTHSFFNNDFGLFTYPVAYYTRESIWHGELPLWNPLSNCGIPFLAQWNTTVCYPLSWLYILFPLPWSLNYFCLGHIVLAGVGMHSLSIRWTGNRFAASVAALAYAFNGLTLNCLMWTSNLAALAWLPFTILCVERAWREGGRAIILAAFVASMQMLSGAPEIILVTWILLGTLWIGQVWVREVPLFLAVRRFATVVTVVFGLTAIQLLPFLELLRHCDRDLGPNNHAWSMPAWGWANFLVPLFRCSRSILGPYFQIEQQWASSYYLGIGVLALGVMAAWKVRGPRLRWLAIVALSGILLALGEKGFIYSIIQRAFPALGLARYPIKFVSATVFAFPLLAAFGVNWIQRAQNDGAGTARPLSAAEPRRTLLCTGLALLALSVVIVAASNVFPYRDESWQVTFRNGLERVLFLILIICGFFLQAKTLDSSKRRWLGLGILILLGLDILTHAPSQNPTVLNRAYGPLPLEMSAPPHIGKSRAMVSPRMQALLPQVARPNPLVYYVGSRRSLFENCNLLANCPKVNGFFSVYVHEEAAVRSLLYTSTNFPSGLADFLGVSQISSPDEFWKWIPRTTTLPMITTGQQPVFKTPDETLKALASPEFNARALAYLPLEARPNFSHLKPVPAEITHSKFSAHRISLELSAREPTLLVIAQTFFPCWRAYVDGHATKLWRANHAFQALEVPAGNHHVSLSYRDYYFYAGAALSGMTLLGCLLTLARWHVSCGKDAYQSVGAALRGLDAPKPVGSPNQAENEAIDLKKPPQRSSAGA